MKDESFKKLSHLIEAYDDEVIQEENKLKEAQKQLRELTLELQTNEDSYRQVLHEKEVNKALRDEWSIKINVVPRKLILEIQSE